MSLAHLRARLAALHVSISEHRLALKELERDRKAVERELQAFTYPVLTIPPEITSEIFLHCLPEDNEPPSRNDVPIVLLAVCTAWRSVAISVPELWESLCLDVGRIPHSISTNTFNAIPDIWFGRAYSRPLTLSLRGGGWYRRDYFDLLRCYAPRLRSLSLHLDMPDFQGLKDIGPFPLLQALTIGLPFNEGQTVENLESDIFEDAPVLRQLSLVEGTVLSFIPLPLERLTVLYADLSSTDECLAALKSSPLLTDCTFRFGNEVYHGPEVSHSRLQSLTLFRGKENFYATGDIFNHITLPSLHTLKISGVDDLNEDGALEAFISRSSPPLRKFHFNDYYTSGSRREFHPESLGCMSTLTHIEFKDLHIDFEDDFLDLLANEADSFLPGLQNIVFLDTAYPGSGYSNLAKTLDSRWMTDSPGVAALRSLQVIWPVDLQPYFSTTVLPFAELFTKLVAKGACIHIGPVGRNYLLKLLT
ncbi:hypothetical protein C8F04DRAFT_1102765 [Mycena alexandri]|uniref:F-box domain-containing protein n=1 Tax=Mycena alexandri TaxID=1745969 RepID=A0AAD6X6J4_9AGAR|nr:hypothetical protein C8F04DRAFT_1102765 [Mycena alexandri]